MAGRIPQHFIDELVARTDIIEVIGSRVQLKRAGREYKACCPFHDEKTPSFTVSADKQFYHCFGCGAHGTALGFVMELRPSRFRRGGRGTRGARRSRGAARRRRCRARAPNEELYVALERAALFFRQSLSGEPTGARLLARARPGSPDSIARFGIGYAPHALGRPARPLRHEPTRNARCCCARVSSSSATEPPRRQRPLRSLPRPRHVPDPRCARPHDRLRRTRARPGRAEVSELARNRAVPQGPRALRAVRGAAGDAQPAAPAGRRGLHGRRAACTRPASPMPSRRSVRRRRPSTCSGFSASSAKSCSASTVTAPDAPRPGARSRTRWARSSRAGRCASCSCPTVTIRTRSSARKARRPSRRGSAAAMPAVRLPDRRACVALRHGERRRQGAAGRAGAAADPADPVRRLSRAAGGPAGREWCACRPRVSAELLGPAGPDRERPSRAGGGPGGADVHGRRPTRRPLAGRGNLVRQAVTLLVHFPAPPRRRRRNWRPVRRRPARRALLLELLAQLREDPAPSTAVLLERWRDRPEHTSLSRLAVAECLAPDAGRGGRGTRSPRIARLVAEENPGAPPGRAAGPGPGHGAVRPGKAGASGAPAGPALVRSARRSNHGILDCPMVYFRSFLSPPLRGAPS